jgi:outer membrane lipoprotein-sorting protein
MPIPRFLVATAAAAMLLLAASQSGQASTPSNPVLQRLIALDDRLHSYTADVRADVVMHSFPYLSPSLTGTYYHKEPNKNKIVFTGGVPFIANQFSNVYPRVESPSHWNDVYVISSQDDGTYTHFRLVPRQQSRIDHVAAKVADQSGELAELRWNYTGGGYATLKQSYGEVGAYWLVTHQTGHFEDSNYNADVTSTFSNFKLNAQIPDSIFND